MNHKISLGLILALAACGAARVIQRTQMTGVVELQGERAKAMDAANQEMAAHCGPNNYTVVREGEELIGCTCEGPGASSPASPATRPSAPISKAWRVHYQCNGAPDAGPAPAPAPAAPPPGAPPTAPPPTAPPPTAPPPPAPPPPPGPPGY